MTKELSDVVGFEAQHAFNLVTALNYQISMDMSDPSKAREAISYISRHPKVLTEPGINQVAPLLSMVYALNDFIMKHPDSMDDPNLEAFEAIRVKIESPVFKEVLDRYRDTVDVSEIYWQMVSGFKPIARKQKFSYIAQPVEAPVPAEPPRQLEEIAASAPTVPESAIAAPELPDTTEKPEKKGDYIVLMDPDALKKVFTSYESVSPNEQTALVGLIAAQVQELRGVLENPDLIEQTLGNYRTLLLMVDTVSEPLFVQGTNGMKKDYDSYLQDLGMRNSIHAMDELRGKLEGKTFAERLFAFEDKSLLQLYSGILQELQKKVAKSMTDELTELVTKGDPAEEDKDAWRRPVHSG